MLTLPWVLVTQGYTLIKLHRNLKAVHSTIEAMKKKVSLWVSDIEIPELSTEGHRQEMTTDSREWPPEQSRVSRGQQGCASSGGQPPRKELGQSLLPRALSALSSSEFHSLLISTSAEHPMGVERKWVMTRPCSATGGCQTHQQQPFRGTQGAGVERPAETHGHHRGHYKGHSTCLHRCPLLSSNLMKQEGSEGGLNVSVHLPGLCQQVPGWPQSPQATCPQ